MVRQLHHLRDEELQAEYQEAHPLERAALSVPDEDHDVLVLFSFFAKVGEQRT